MANRMPLAAAILLLLSLAPDSPGAEDPPTPKANPLPVDKSQRLIQENAVYTVEGRVRIPKGVEVTVLRSIRITGIGSAPAVIEVEGGFDCIGVFGREVILENVTVEPCAKFASIRMDMVIARGSGGIRSPKDVSVNGFAFLENFDMLGSTELDVTFEAGSVKLSGICADSPVKIRSTIPAGKQQDQVRIFIRGCHQEPTHRCTPHGGRVGLVGGLDVDGGDDVTIQLSRIGGSLCSVRNWGQRLIFDGNKVNAEKLLFAHRAAGRYQRVQCAKLDVYSSEVSASAPLDKVLKDTFTMDRCWFKGLKTLKEVHEKVVKDADDSPSTNGVRVVMPKVDDRAHELAGPEDR